MRIGRLQLRRDRDRQAEDPGRYLSRLGELAAMLDGLPWILAGGLAIPLTVGGFYRRHYDVDVVFPVEAFAAVERALCGAGYALGTYFPMSFFGRWRFALHAPVRSTSRLVRRRTRKLKFRDVTGRRDPPHLLSVIEALPYRIEHGHLVTCDGRHRIPKRYPLVGHRHRTQAGHEIQCLHLHYVGLLKGPRREARDVQDFEAIARAVTRPAALVR